MIITRSNSQMSWTYIEFKKNMNDLTNYTIYDK